MDPTNPETVQTEGEKPEAKDIQVPKARLDEAESKRKALASELDAARKELETLKKSATQQPAPNDATAAGFDQLRKEVEEIKAQSTISGIQRDLGATADQAAKVFEVMKSTPGLSASEARMIAGARHPDVFGASDSRSYNPAIHGSERPTTQGGPPRKADAHKQLYDNARKATTQADRVDLVAKAKGVEAARAMGLPIKD